MRALAVALPFVLAACAPDPTPAEPPAEPVAEAAPRVPASADTTAARPIAPGSRPATAVGTVSIEGSDEPIDLRLVTVEDTPLPFSTYVPASWSDDVLGSGEGTGARFAMGGSGAEGVVTVFVPSEPNRAGIEELARVVAESNGTARAMTDRPAWARAGYTFSGPAALGSVLVGEHAGVPFYILRTFPPDMGDGFAPRAALVLDRLRWADDGTALGG